MSTKLRVSLASLLLLSYLFPLGLSKPARAIAATIVVQNDFEDGTTQGWGPRGSAVPAASAEAAHTGTRSLKTTGRTAAWNGPSRNLLATLQKGAVYEIGGYVRLPAGTAADQLIMTVQRTPAGGTTAFDRVVASPAGGVTDAAWVLLQGQYTFTTDSSELQLYVESPNATLEFYLDDFTITLISEPPPPTGTVVQNGFEDATAQGWVSRGSAALAAVTEAARTGSYSLKTTGRTAVWNGPSRNLMGTLQKGGVYQITGYVRLVAGQPASQLIMTVQRTPVGGTQAFDRVVASPA